MPCSFLVACVGLTLRQYLLACSIASDAATEWRQSSPSSSPYAARCPCISFRTTEPTASERTMPAPRRTTAFATESIGPDAPLATEVAMPRSLPVRTWSSLIVSTTSLSFQLSCAYNAVRRAQEAGNGFICSASRINKLSSIIGLQRTWWPAPSRAGRQVEFSRNRGES